MSLQSMARVCVSLWRNDPTFADAEICVEGETFLVHRVVMSSLSPFFLKAFSGPFKEADKKRVEVKETSGVAVSVLVEFAYGNSIEKAVIGNVKLACKVISLAHRYEVPDLSNNAATATVAISHASVDSIIVLYLHLKRLDSEKQHRPAFLLCGAWRKSLLLITSMK